MKIMSFVFLITFLWIVQHPFSAPVSHFIRLLGIGKPVLERKLHIGLGGLGHMGVKIAHALGAEVTVLSHSLKKQEEAKKMGADNFYATSDPERLLETRGYFDLDYQYGFG